MAMTSSAISPAVQRALTKLEASLDAGQSYEAHELFKTVFHRFRARKQFEDSYQLAESGALLQLTKGQLNCGTELGCMLVEAYTKDETPATDTSFQRVLHVMQAFPTEGDEDEDASSPPIESCSKVGSAATKWLRKVNGLQYAPSIYGALATYITQCLGWVGLGIAMPHYARSDNLSNFAKAVAAAVAEGSPEEEDLFIVRAVLYTACTKPVCGSLTSLARAKEVLSSYPAAAGHAVPSTPLTNFLSLYLEALEKRSAPLVDMLLKQYEMSLERDPSLEDLTGKARAMYAPAPVASSQGMFGDLFRSMLMPT